MNILAIETSSEACSCALAGDGEPPRERFEVAPRRHTERVLGMVDALLADAGLAPADLDAVAFGRGPGSFTGVRIAACTAQGLALAARCPVLPVSSLAALAARAGAPGERVLAAFDARLGEVYLGAFRIRDDGLPQAVGEEQLASPGELAMPAGEGWIGAGAGWRSHGGALAARLGGRLAAVREAALPGAAEVARLGMDLATRGGGVPAARALPGYLRHRVATPRRAGGDSEAQSG